MKFTEISKLKEIRERLNFIKIETFDEFIKVAEKIINQRHRDYCKEHSSILNLLDKYIQSEESYFECFKRLISKINGDSE